MGLLDRLLLPIAKKTENTPLEKVLSQISRDFAQYNPVSQTYRATKQTVPLQKDFEKLKRNIKEVGPFLSTIISGSPYAQSAKYSSLVGPPGAIRSAEDVEQRSRRLLPALEQSLPYEKTLSSIIQQPFQGRSLLQQLLPKDSRFGKFTDITERTTRKAIPALIQGLMNIFPERTEQEIQLLRTGTPEQIQQYGKKRFGEESMY